MQKVIYYSTFDTPLPADVFNTLLNALPATLSQKVMKYRRWEDRHAALLGKHLLIKAMKDRDIETDLNELCYTAAGRPYLANLPDFNISHSGNRVVCVLEEEGKVGIDIEVIQAVDHAEFKSCFSPQEWHTLMQATAPLPLFYKYWTIKEAILKGDGRGIAESLRSLDVSGSFAITLDNKIWHITAIGAFAGYACHIASTVPGTAYLLQKVNFSELSPT